MALFYEFGSSELRIIQLKNRNQFNFTNTLILKIYITSLAISYFIKSLLPGYLGYNATAALSTTTEDGWCEPNLQGIGSHCFSDFYNVMAASNSKQPWSSTPNPSPPFGLLIFRFFSLEFWNVGQSRVALLVYLSIGIFGITMSFWLFVKKYCDSLTARLLGLCLVFLSSPILILIDRANYLIFLIPLHFLILHYFIQNKNKQMLLLLGLLVLMKPHFVVYSLLFVINGRYKTFLKSIVFSSLLLLISFGLYPLRILENIKDYLKQIEFYQNYTNAGAIYPPNISMFNFYYTLKRIFAQLFPGSIGLDPEAKWLFQNQIFTIAITLVILVIFLIGMNYRTKANNYAIVVFITILVTNVSFAYYLSLLIPMITLYFLTDLENTKYKFNLVTSNAEKIVFTLMLIFLFVPWSIPWTVFSKLKPYSWSEVSFTWLIGQAFLLVFFLILLLKGLRQGFNVRAEEKSADPH
jgi:hypothetical protein